MNEYWIGNHRNERGKLVEQLGGLNGTFVYFRRKFSAPRECALSAKISANSRYKLWINEIPVVSGPCKGDLYEWYYDDVELTPYLKEGENVIYVQVLFCSKAEATDMFGESTPIFSVMSPEGGHKLLFCGQLVDGEQNIITDLNTGMPGWECLTEQGYRLVSDKASRLLGSTLENIRMDHWFYRWRERDSSISYPWKEAQLYESVVGIRENERCGILHLMNLKKRPIPLLYEKEYTVVLSSDVSHCCNNKRIFIPIVFEKGEGVKSTSNTSLEIGDGFEYIFDIFAIQNAFLCFYFSGGEGDKIRITYFERFLDSVCIEKRDAWETGGISGISDTIELNGDDFFFEPFWFRTFRYIRISVEGEERTARLQKIIFRRTGYALEEKTSLSFSDECFEKVWSISVRTLENCMMDTYMDCPYYEQLQYVMDARLEALYTYALSNDTRLARKALEDFHRSMTPDGLVQGRYPSVYSQIISTFSFHYIYMISEYYEHTKDEEVIRKYIFDVDRIVYYFTQREEDGLLGALGYWEFADWQDSWKETEGSPLAVKFGVSSLINLMYAYALEKAAFLHGCLKDTEKRDFYTNHHDRIVAAVVRLCWDEDRGLFREGPNCSEFTQQTQALMVMTGGLPRKKQQELLLNMSDDSTVLSCTFATAYDVLRAFEKAGIYESSYSILNQWMRLPDNQCTCIPEKPYNARSDCHGWGALPIYEFVRMFAGINRDRVGWKRVKICPHLMQIEELRGKVETPNGAIRFVYTKQNGRRTYRIILPPGMEGSFYMYEESYYLKSGENTISFQENILE